MAQLFSLDGKLYRLLSKAADLVVLNLLWIICSLPVITLGASTTAMNYVALKMARGEEGYVARSFFQSFRQNFKKSTVLWGLMAAMGIVLYFDFYFVSHVSSQAARFMTIPLMFIGILLLMTSCYVFWILAWFENSMAKTVKYALMMAIAHLPYTLLIVILTLGPALLLLAGNLMASSFMDIIIGFSLFAWLNAHLFGRVFKRYMPAAENAA